MERKGDIEIEKEKKEREKKNIEKMSKVTI